MNDDSIHPWIEPELEARIVALVVGEASDFETEELERLIEEKPELGLFRQRMEMMHGMLESNGRTESISDAEDWKLSSERREKVVAVLGDGPSGEGSREIAGESTRRGRGKIFAPLLKIAAVVALLAVFGALLMPAHIGMRSSAVDSVSEKSEMIAFERQASEKGGAKTVTMSSLDVDSNSFFKEGRSAGDGDVAAARREYAQIGHGGYDDKKIVPGQSVADKSEIAVTAGGDVEVLRESFDDSSGRFNFSVGGSDDLLASSAPEELLRSKTLDEVEEGGESVDSRMPQLKFPEKPSAPLAAAKANKRPGVLGDEISAGYMSDYVFSGRRKQHGGTTPLSAASTAEPATKNNDVLHGGVALSVDFGEEEGLIEKNDSMKGTSQLALLDERAAIALRPADELDATLGKKRKEQELLRDAPVGIDETSAEKEPFSTFSLHVSDVSFKLAQAALAKGEWPDEERIRIEEFVNAFDYGDPMPSQEDKVAAALEQTAHPFLQQRNLLRVSMRTAATGRNASTPLRLTFLLDNSGSMERVDRRKTVQKAFAMLASMLQPADQVTLITFARQPRLIADRVSGAEGDALVEKVADLPSEGGTNLEAALNLAFEKAREQQTPGAQNRIILLTDGAANLGDAEPERLSARIEEMRDAGIAFDAAGIGTEGLNDEILEALTRKGDGRYYLLDDAESVDAGFAKQIAGALRPAAGNVKVQIEFNPERVGKYKLLGFEKHRLNKEDFRNDKVDAAELAAAEAGVAVYQVEAKPDGRGDIGSAFVRFRDMATGKMTERRWAIPYLSHPSSPEQASPSMQVATVATMFGAKLKGGPLSELVDLDDLIGIASALPPSWRAKPRIVELRAMLESARVISGH